MPNPGYRFKEFGPGERARNIAAFELSEDDEVLKSKANGLSFNIGKFELLGNAELHSRLVAAGPPPKGKLTKKNVVGSVQTLILDKKNTGAVFQAASQGPACALVCPAALVYRNYFVNGKGHGLESIATLLDNDTKGWWEMRNGYAMPARDARANTSIAEVGAVLKANPLLSAACQAALKVGVHWSTDVTSRKKGKVENKHQVCQIYASACPTAYGRIMSTDWEPLASLVLRGAYEATLAAGALLAVQRQKRVTVYLTCLGGGAFGNRTLWIKDAIDNAVQKYNDYPLDVRLVHFGAVDSQFKDFQ